MSLSQKIPTQELSVLINKHLEEFLEPDQAWQISDSPLSGRGLFARRNIAAGEIIFKDHALVSGPAANLSAKLNTCCVCYCGLNDQSDKEILCKNGCSLPLCQKCTNSEKHEMECQLLRQWQPKDKTKVNIYVLRIISIIRCFSLNQLQRKILYSLQSHNDKYYKNELEQVAKCFEYFPKESDLWNDLYRIICIFNTNTFEGECCVAGHESLVRALFPLAALLNHQCLPNALHHFENATTLVLTATRSIGEGEEIVTSYCKLLWSNLSRKLFLAMTKHFICACKRCLDPTVS